MTSAGRQRLAYERAMFAPMWQYTFPSLGGCPSISTSVGGMGAMSGPPMVESR